MELNRTLLKALGERYDSFYLYDEGEILRRIGELKGAFPSLTFLYSAKANPHPQVLDTVLSQGLGVDAASPAEARMGADRGLSPNLIHFSAPGKTEAGIAASLDGCTLVADSVGELARIQRIAENRNRRLDIGIRVNPAFGFGGGAGQPSKFGIDEEQLFSLLPRWRALPNLRLVGLHVHLKSQNLDRGLLEDYCRRVLALAERISKALGRGLDFVNLGSGIGIPYRAGDVPLDLSALGETVEMLCQRFRRELPHTRLLGETGRYIVGPAGVYVTKVLDKKVSRGETFLLLSNTLNGFLRAPLGRMLEGCAAAPCEPLFSGKDTVSILPLTDRRETERVTLAGNLCTAADTVAEGILLPRLEPGELVAFPNAGSYAAVLSPMGFSSQTPPKQVFLTGEGTLIE